MTRIGHGLGVCALLAVAACSSTSKDKSAAGSDGGGTGGSNGKGGAGNAGGGADSGTRLFKLNWAFADATPVSAEAGAPDAAPVAKPPLGGVKVCVDQHKEIDCVTSAADGTFTLAGLPPLTNLVLTFDKTGYVRASKTIQTASTDMQGTPPIDIFPTGTIDVPPDGVTLETGKGAVLFFTIGPVPGSSDPNAFRGLAGASVAISPVAGKGPFYIAANSTKIDKSLTKTGSGTGYFYNLDPGDYTLLFDDPVVDCAPISIGLSGWGVPVPPNGTKFTVLADYTADEIGVFCTQKSVIVGGDGG